MAEAANVTGFDGKEIQGSSYCPDTSDPRYKNGRYVGFRGRGRGQCWQMSLLSRVVEVRRHWPQDCEIDQTMDPSVAKDPPVPKH